MAKPKTKATPTGGFFHDSTYANLLQPWSNLASIVSLFPKIVKFAVLTYHAICVIILST
jgi:hypothetical protein